MPYQPPTCDHCGSPLRRPIDIAAWSNPSFLQIVPETDEGFDWCEEHINAEPELGAYLAEHRYGPDILLAAHEAGLVVSLDGRIADAEAVQ